MCKPWVQLPALGWEKPLWAKESTKRVLEGLDMAQFPIAQRMIVL
jgi:hypothetical protein